MSLTEILQAVQVLDRDEKIQLYHVLEAEVGTTCPSPEDAELLAKCFPAGVSFEIREPFFAPEAAAILMELLEAEKHQK